MRKVVASEFVSLDGVVESPEKWHFPYFNDQMGEAIGAAMAASDAMLMGRVLYEEWVEFCHSRGSSRVVETTYFLTPFIWAATGFSSGSCFGQNSTLIGDNVAEEISKFKEQPGKDISISGSPTLVRSLLEEDLLDELRLMLHPIVVGSGKRLFEEGSDQKALELLDSKTFSTGVLYLTYQPAQS